MHSNERKDISEICSGDICAIVGLKNTTTGDTLCDEKHPIILEQMEFPEPVIQLSLEPKTKAGQEKMTAAGWMSASRTAVSNARRPWGLCAPSRIRGGRPLQAGMRWNRPGKCAEASPLAAVSGILGQWC